MITPRFPKRKLFEEKKLSRIPELIVMLTHNDLTVDNALEIFSSCKKSSADFWGIKEKSLPPEKMFELFSVLKKNKKTSALEVVTYTEEEGLAGARLAEECGCDILMGTIFFDSINEFCLSHNLKYMPFVGTVTARPSILDGSIEKMISDAKSYIKKGAYGIDLLGYRYTGNPYLLNETFIKNIDAPTCIAGSVDSYERLDEIKKISPWAFTIGSAFFEKKFGEEFLDQINNVIAYMKN